VARDDAIDAIRQADALTSAWSELYARQAQPWRGAVPPALAAWHVDRHACTSTPVWHAVLPARTLAARTCLPSPEDARVGAWLCARQAAPRWGGVWLHDLVWP
jgi:hypothetical protein